MCTDQFSLWMVSWQGYGRSLWLMHGMFKANGGCGYVKKPDFLLKIGPNNEIFDPKARLPVKTTLRVTEGFIALRFHLSPSASSFKCL